MKAKRLIPLVAGLLTLAGCATQGKPVADQSHASQYDRHYVGMVNAIADQTGTKVIWVNPPRQRAASSERKPADG